MFYPKVIYEKLPLAYILISSSLLVNHQMQTMLFSSVLFYCAACITFVERSANRRRDKETSYSIKRHIPELMYEYMPYGMVAISVISLLKNKQEVWQFSAISLIIVALRHLMCRHFNRLKRPLSC
jgi:hypothetical protein